MKIKIQKLALILIAIGPIAFTQSCGPNLARTNARIEKGLDLGVSAMYNRTSKDTVKHKQQNITQVNMEVGGGYKNESNLGMSVLGKAGFFSMPALDVYLELPSTHPFYYGVGMELSGGYGGYLIGSYYFTEQFFTTFTGRVMRWNDRFEKQNLFNPQLAVGYTTENGLATTSLFVGYHYFTGEGIDMDDDIDGRGYTGYVNRLIYGGISVEF